MSIHLILMVVFFTVVGVAAIGFTMVRCGFFKSLFFSVLSGVGTLLALHFTSLMTGLQVPVNWFSLGICAGGGVPGVAALVLMHLFW